MRIYLEFCLWSGVFYFILFWYHFFIYTLMSNGGKADRHRYTYTDKHTDTHADRHTHTPVYPCPTLGHAQGEEKGFTWFLKSLKALPQNSAHLVDAKAKSHLLMVRDAQLLCMVSRGSLNGSVATLW